MVFKQITKGSNLLKHVVVRHASPDQELLGPVGVNEVLPDPAKDDGRLLGDRETILNVNQGQKPSVDIGVGVAAPRHDLKKDSQSDAHEPGNISSDPCFNLK